MIQVGIINYGKSGNTHNVEKALKRVGAATQLIDTPEALAQSDKLILPGVGSFTDGMQSLAEKSLIEPLQQYIAQKPTLGICLGMQLLSQLGFEFQKTQGLGMLDAEVRPILCEAPTPHMGFNRIKIQKHSPILAGIENASFYFMHSFEMVNYTDVLALTHYEHHQFVSAVSKGNIFGVQFHPEKSRDPGLTLLENFIQL